MARLREGTVESWFYSFIDCISNKKLVLTIIDLIIKIIFVCAFMMGIFIHRFRTTKRKKLMRLIYKKKEKKK